MKRHVLWIALVFISFSTFAQSGTVATADDIGFIASQSLDTEDAVVLLVISDNEYYVLKSISDPFFDPEHVEIIEVLKDDAAMQAYGAENGVIMIHLKKRHQKRYQKKVKGE